ncbi:MAG: hypothetical protein LUF04_04045 [Bacteroides sp.]|nr:hypothetical protein [Bacteroides sp.]
MKNENRKNVVPGEIQEIIRLLDTAMHAVSDAKEELQKLQQEQVVHTQRLVVHPDAVPLVIELMVWGLQEKWIRAETDNSRAAIADLLDRTFFFCQKDDPEKCLSQSSILNYLKKIYAGEVPRKVTKKCLLELIRKLKDYLPD